MAAPPKPATEEPDMAAEFDARAAQVREYLDAFYAPKMKEWLQGLAQERPQDARAALAQVCKGNKTVKEIAKEPKAEASLRSAAPRQYLNTTITPALTQAMAKCFKEQPRRPITELGEILAEKKS